MAGDPSALDLYGPLPPPGVTVIEASAGTGKTHTIAALVTRFVAEAGAPIEEILAVTFTRLATAELRERVRSRMASAEEALGRVVDTGAAPPEDDALVAFLARTDPPKLRERRRRLADALASFDAATITTTHGFCHLVLAGLGIAGDVAVGASLTEDAGDTIDEVVDDLYLRWALLHRESPPFDLTAARRIARDAVANPETVLLPEAGKTPSGLRSSFAKAVRAEVRRRLLDANLLTYDDLLVRLRSALEDGSRREVARRKLRDQYTVVLVDELQDTDPVQWKVVRAAFGSDPETRSRPATTLVLIGDPKQAIYTFRGGDVYAYLDAADHARWRYTLGENWRSDQGLLDALDALLRPLRLGHPEIEYRSVTAVAAHRRPGIDGAPHPAPLRVRMVHVADGLVKPTKSGPLQKDAAVEWVARDLAFDAVGLLTSGATLCGGSAGSGVQRRPIAPNDLAVLVRTNRQAAVVQTALHAAGVPAVVAGTDSVFATNSAGNWLKLLEALEEPQSRSRAAALALTPFVGMDGGEVATAGEEAWERLHARLHRWAGVLRDEGVASLARVVLSAGRLARILEEVSGERILTDLGHIAQLLHSAAAADQLGTPALRAWLARRIAENTEAADETDAEERSRRLESDAEAVQVLTVHRAKGLEFPTVYCPYLWDPGRDLESGQPLLFHDGRHGFVRSLDVGGDGSDDSNLRAARSEQVGEDLRLLYVALTRARHQVVLWWAQSYRSQHSPLGRLLVSRQPDGDVADGGKKPPSDQAILQHLEAVAAKAPSLVSIERCTPPPGGRWEPDRAAISNLRAAAFARRLDLSWRRTSYTAITSGAHDPAYAGDPIVGSEPEEPGTTDEPAVATGAPSVPAARAAIAGNRALGGERPARGAPGMTGGVAEDHLRSVRSSWAEVPGGRSMGTFVHQVLQRTDFAAASLESEVATAVAAQADGRPGGPEAPEVLVAAIVGSLSTPLGPIVGNASLRALGRADRLDEVGFELPLAGGDHPSGEVLTTDVANLLSAHTRPGDPLEGYATRLASPALASHLRGYLTGSIDLVARFPDHTGAARYLVVDYKTNWLAPEGEGLSAWHYRPDALAAEMQRAHYPLQALLYVVALHRYLRWRLPGYAAESHLGGVLYLFLRGMAGPATPVTADTGVPCGVFTWRTPAALVTGLSDLIDRGPEQ